MMHTRLAMTLLEACDDDPEDILYNVLVIGRESEAFSSNIKSKERELSVTAGFN
jgi:hypothetical protein